MNVNGLPSVTAVPSAEGAQSTPRENNVSISRFPPAAHEQLHGRSFVRKVLENINMSEINQIKNRWDSANKIEQDKRKETAKETINNFTNSDPLSELKKTHVVSVKEAEFLETIQAKIDEKIHISSADISSLEKLKSKYFKNSENNLFNEKIKARDLLRDTWPDVEEFDGKSKYTLVETKEGRAKAAELYNFFSRGSEGMQHIERAVGAAGDKNLKYKKEEHFFGLITTFRHSDRDSDKHDLRNLLHAKGILTKEEMGLLVKYEDNKSYMNDEERETIFRLYHTVLGPLNKLLQEESYKELTEVANDKELKRLEYLKNKIKSRPEDLSASNVNELKKLAVKFYSGGENSLLKRRKRAAEGLRSTIEDLEPSHILNPGHPMFGYVNSITKNDRELIKKFVDNSYSFSGMNPNDRKKLTKLLHQKLKPIQNEIQKENLRSYPDSTRISHIPPPQVSEKDPTEIPPVAKEKEPEIPPTAESGSPIIPRNAPNAAPPPLPPRGTTPPIQAQTPEEQLSAPSRSPKRGFLGEIERFKKDSLRPTDPAGKKRSSGPLMDLLAAGLEGRRKGIAGTDEDSPERDDDDW